MPVRESYQLPWIDVQSAAYQRHLVGERDVDVSEGVLGELHQLRRARVGHVTGPLDEKLVQPFCSYGAGRGDASYDAVVRYKLLKGATRQYAFGAVCDANVTGIAIGVRKGQVRACRREPAADCFGCPDRAGRFDYHEVAYAHDRSQAVYGCSDIAHIRLVIVTYGSRHGDNERICRHRLTASDQAAGCYRIRDQGVEARFVERICARNYHLNSVGVDIYSDHLDAVTRQDRRVRQSDVAQSQYTYAPRSFSHRSSP